MSQDPSSGGLLTTLASKERFNLNLSTQFIELVLVTAKMFRTDGERVLRRARGSYAPYRIRNRTGCSIFVWSDPDGNTSIQHSAMAEIAHDKTIDWRFDDWKTMREVTKLLLVLFIPTYPILARLLHFEQQHWFAVCRQAMGAGPEHTGGSRRRV